MRFSSCILENCTLLTNKKAAEKGGRGIETADLSIVEKGVIVCNHEGKIEWVGPRSEFSKSAPEGIEEYEILDLDERVLMPALIDCHTHLVFGGNRSAEFEMRLAGASYQEIAENGGGIISTVNSTRNATEEDLYQLTVQKIAQIMNFGVGTIETKSGYGLDVETELKLLRVIKRIKNETDEAIQAVLSSNQDKNPLEKSTETSIDKMETIENFLPELHSTFLGPHAIPAERKDNVDRFLDEMTALLPQIKEEGLATACDIFTEKGYFSVAQSKKFLKTALDQGFDLHVHADELSCLGGAEMAAELGAKSADHLLCISDTGIKKLSQSDTVAVMLPGTSFYLNTEDAPARKLLDAGALVAIATDFNPGSCMSFNLPLMMTMCCIRMKMQIVEAIVGVTYNAARVLGVENRKGALLPGYDADFLVLDSKNYQDLIYQFG